MRIIDRLRRRKKPNEGIDKIDAVEREILKRRKKSDRDLRRAERKARWRDRLQFLSGLLGNIAGTALGTKKIGLVVALAIGALALTGIMKWVM